MPAIESIAAAAVRALAASPSPGDQAQALTAYRQRAEAGDPDAAWRYAELWLRDPGHEPAEALPFLRQAAQAGIPAAIHRLGGLLQRGEAGLERQPEAGARLCRQAAESGYGPAQFDLALLHAAGKGVPQDAASASRWLLCAAANGVEAATTCLETIERPRSWDAADTRLSVVLTRSGQHKPMRFAEYYCDPCLDLLVGRLRIDRNQAEDIVQQFFLELEEPLAKGAHAGQPWKEALRGGFDPSRGPFRAYLRRALERFAQDWKRDQRREIPGGALPVDLDEALAERQEAWRLVLDRFVATHAARTPPIPRACAMLSRALGEGVGQATLAAAYGVTDRTVRSGVRLAAELLRDAVLAELPPTAGAPLLIEAIHQIPAWCQHLSDEKRRKCLVTLALVAAVVPASPAPLADGAVSFPVLASPAYRP